MTIVNNQIRSYEMRIQFLLRFGHLVLFTMDEEERKILQHELSSCFLAIDQTYFVLNFPPNHVHSYDHRPKSIRK